MIPADDIPNPSSSAESSFVLLAEAYRKEGLLEDAVRICRGGLTRFPASLPGRIVLAKILLDQGALAGASDELKRVRSEAGDRPEVLAALEEALQGVSPPSDETQEPIEPGVLVLDPPQETIQRQDLAGEASARDPLATPTLAKLFASQGDTARAEAILSQLERSDGSTGPSEVPPRDQARQRYLGRLVVLREIVQRERRTRLS
jgi:hypothetical protein